MEKEPEGPKAKVRYLMTLPEQPVPFYIDSIGYNPEQEPIARSEGYPVCHWLQTAAGTGEIRLESGTFRLPEHHGILLLPNVPHRYEAVEGVWSTYYLTFGGPLVNAVMTTLDIRTSVVYRFDPDGELGRLLPDMLDRVSRQPDITGLRHSVDVYRFIVALKQHAHTVNRASLHSLAERLAPLVEFLELEYWDPDLNMADMAARAGVSPRRLNTLFREAFGYTPYQYLIALRIRKAKEFLLMDRSATVRTVAKLVGFRDVSHFIATFRRLEQMTPEQFRLIHGRPSPSRGG